MKPKRALLSLNMLFRACLLLSAVLILGGCAAQISYEKLFPGVKQVRTNVQIELEFVDSPNDVCRNEVKQATGKSAPLMSYFGACAIIEPDTNLKPDVMPTCKIILPKENWHKAMEHEIFHCLGYDHE
jgi:hypothetical protein